MFRRLAERTARTPMQRVNYEDKARALDVSAQVIRDLLASDRG